MGMLKAPSPDFLQQLGQSFAKPQLSDPLPVPEAPPALTMPSDKNLFKTASPPTYNFEDPDTQPVQALKGLGWLGWGLLAAGVVGIYYVLRKASK